MNDTARRAIRTFAQASLVTAVIALLAGFDVIAWTTLQTALVMGVATPCVALLQNLLEDRAAIPKLLRPTVIEVLSPPAG